MAKLKAVEHKRTKAAPRSLRRKHLNQSSELRMRRGKGNSTLKYSREVFNSSINYLSRNKLLTFLALGIITASSLTYIIRRRSQSSSFINRWLTDRF